MATAIGYTYWTYYEGVHNPTITLFMSKTTTDISFTMTMENIVGGSLSVNWTAWLQKYESGKWVNVASRTGYLSDDSPSSRTFTDVGGAGKTMRLYVGFENSQQETSKTFTR